MGVTKEYAGPTIERVAQTLAEATAKQIPTFTPATTYAFWRRKLEDTLADLEAQEVLRLLAEGHRLTVLCPPRYHARLKEWPE